MQGYLSEIDIRSILQLIELGQRTGELYLESYGSGSSQPMGQPFDGALTIPDPPSWLVFLANGQLVYAGTTDNKLDRLRDHLHRYGIDHSLPDPGTTAAIAAFNSLEYGTLWALLEQHVITPDQGRTILSHMVHETLFDLLSLHHGAFVFQLSSALSPQLMTHAISDLVAGMTQQIQTWHQLHPHLQSPDQCPVLLAPEAFRASVSNQVYQRMVTWMDGKTSIRRIGRYLNRDLLSVARSLVPAIQQGQISLVYNTAAEVGPAPSTQRPGRDRLPRIVCVDDSATVRQAVERILDGHGYEATSIGNPLKALGLLFQLQPNLILCDITMPELDGYELCAMLRHSSAFRQTPIVMLTGKDGFLDRVKARMVGATDYLTKPFGPGELLALVEKYVGPGDLNRPRPDTLLAEAIEDEFDIDFSQASLPR
ncbi:response regulator [Nodosilinea sp. LEGE 06152]|uniref:response regulator n=1 Tax=Nodosilinea sp. LEGE 06152 TaxID=2777966 RepID=UPI001880EAF2|nr:response regulator [Nodosilinea sp. LEGE 06152]MBE9159473.1 response regulator [Nodosilinea sp. LEGE 06152]